LNGWGSRFKRNGSSYKGTLLKHPLTRNKRHTQGIRVNTAPAGGIEGRTVKTCLREAKGNNGGLGKIVISKSGKHLRKKNPET